MAFKQQGQKSFKLVLLFSMFLVFGVVLAVFIGYRTVSNPQEIMLSSLLRDDATISIDRIHQTSTKNGITDWSLNAASAQFIEKEKQVVFDDLSVTFYLENGGTVSLSARKGYLNTDTRDIHIDGDVVADDGAFKFKTDSLDYEHRRRVLLATEPVQIFGNTFRLNADSASYDMASQKTIFKGKVTGTIFDKIN